MAGFAIAIDTRVRKVRRVPEWGRAGANGRISVADETVLVCRQVIKCLAGTDNTVMTRRAVTRDSSMIKYRADKGRGVMAHRTIICRSNMVQCFTDCGFTVVAGRAVIHDTNMTKCCW